MSMSPESLGRLKFLQQVKSLTLERVEANQREDERTDPYPFGHKIAKYHQPLEPERDVAEIHEEARRRLDEEIKNVYEHGNSVITMIAGPPGMGKSHLLGYLGSHERQADSKYVFICHPNNWELARLEQSLLRWTLDAIQCAPFRTLEGQVELRDLLLMRIEAVAFAGLRRILDKPRYIEGFLRKRGWLNRKLKSALFPSQASFTEFYEKRDVSCFRQLDFNLFSDFVCDTFLDQPQAHSLLHRYTLKVLLRYLFEEDRPLVSAWLLGWDVDPALTNGFLSRTDQTRLQQAAKSALSKLRSSGDPEQAKVREFLLRELGASTFPEARDECFEVLKILIQLFSPDLSKAIDAPGSDRIFLLAFDQAESRLAIFQSEAEWRLFIAKLSEAYNGLPNFMAVFTTPIDFRQTMLNKLEQQFQDRVLDAPELTLHGVEESQLLSLYNKRLLRWLNSNDRDLAERFLALNDAYAPFEKQQLVEAFGYQGGNLRSALTTYREMFLRHLRDEVWLDDPDLDVQHHYYEEAEKDEFQQGPATYSKNHIDQLFDLVLGHAEWVFGPEGLKLTKPPERGESGGVPFCELEFTTSSGQTSFKPNLTVALVPYRGFRSKFEAFQADRIKGKWTDRNFFWILRPGKVDDVEDSAKNVFACSLTSETHARFIALNKTLHEKLDRYPQDFKTTKIPHMVHQRVHETYLGEALQVVKRAMKEHSDSKTAKRVQVTDAKSDPTIKPDETEPS